MNQFIELEIEHKWHDGSIAVYTEYYVNINYITCIHKPLKHRQISVTNGVDEQVWTLSQRSFNNLLATINISKFKGRKRK